MSDSASMASTSLSPDSASLLTAAFMSSMFQIKDYWVQYAISEEKELSERISYFSEKITAFGGNPDQVLADILEDEEKVMSSEDAVSIASNAQDAARAALDATQQKIAALTKLSQVCQSYTNRNDADFNQHLQQLQASITSLRQQATNIQQLIPNITSVAPSSVSSPTSISMGPSLFASSSMVSSVSSTPIPTPSSSAMPSASPQSSYITVASQNLDLAQDAMVNLREKFRSMRIPIPMSQDVVEAYGRAQTTAQGARQYAAESKTAEAATASVKAIEEAKNTITLLKAFCVSVRESHGDLYSQTDHLSDFESLTRLEYSLENAANTLRSQKDRDYPSSVSISSSPLPSASSTSMASSSISTSIPAPGSKEDYAARASAVYSDVTTAIDFFSQRYRDLGLSGNPQDVFSTALTAQGELATAARAAANSSDARTAAAHALEAANKAKIAFSELNSVCQNAFRSHLSTERDSLANLETNTRIVTSNAQALEQEIASQFPAVSSVPPPSPSSVSMVSAVPSATPTPSSYPPPLTAEEKNQAKVQQVKVTRFLLSSDQQRLAYLGAIRGNEAGVYNGLHQISGGTSAQAAAHKLTQIPSSNSTVVADDQKARAQLERVAASAWEHYTERLKLPTPRVDTNPEYVAALNAKAKFTSYIVTDYGIFLVQNPLNPSDPFTLQKKYASDEFFDNIMSANNNYRQSLCVSRAAVSQNDPLLRGQGDKVGSLTAAHYDLGRSALLAGVDFNSLDRAGLSQQLPFAEKARQQLTGERLYASLPRIGADQVPGWFAGKEDRASFGNAVSPFAQNIRVAITPDKKTGGVRLAITTFGPEDETSDSNHDQVYWQRVAQIKYLDPGITVAAYRYSTAAGQRQAFAASLGSPDTDKALLLHYTSHGSSHKELMETWNSAVRAGNSSPSTAVFLAMMKDFSGTMVSTGFLGWYKEDKSKVYIEHTLSCFDEIRNPQARADAVFNFTHKVNLEMSAALNAGPASFTQEQHQEYMQKWIAGIQAHSPELAQAVVARALARIAAIDRSLQTETNPAKIEKLMAEFNSAYIIVSSSNNPQQQAAAIHSVENINRLPAVQGYFKTLAEKREQKAQQVQQADEQLGIAVSSP